MKLKKIWIYGSLLLFMNSLSGCVDDFLNFTPEDKMTSSNFPENKEDLNLLLNGVYGQFRERELYSEGFFGFGVLDGATPNAYNWGNTSIAQVGNGQLPETDGGLVNFRWTRGYAIISRANYLLEKLNEVELNEDDKKMYLGEAHFLTHIAVNRN